MTAPAPWVERAFRFDVPVSLHPNLRARLAGAPSSWEDLFAGRSGEQLTARDGSAWAPVEHVGHLADLEALHDRRLDELLAGAEELSPADMSNALTEERAHRERAPAEVLAAFREVRRAFVARLDGFDEEQFERSARHPRLGQPMRLLDVMVFTCEHDDHHLAAARELLRRRA